MNLGDIQDRVAAGLAASPIFAASNLRVWNPELPSGGSGIIKDDGIGSHIPGVEAALARGLALIVGTYESGAALDTVSGKSAMLVKITVEIQENVETNRGQDGTGIATLDALPEVIRAVSKLPSGVLAQRWLAPSAFKVGAFDKGLWGAQVVFQVTVFFA